ncbi:CHRD domain-containing protein [Pedobacter sp. N36a]|uniref:CHRD domain-containing protein n=1 Tax=Pedobacter sp. N36a TaxID=2767996 RepID=UPI001656B7EF|nr:CHRD domain-containing protein [Pedobacter sp. N36a]MBC8986816.1 CHRD domain-containing protein [Pedobacter sp. N36a]
MRTSNHSKSHTIYKSVSLFALAFLVMVMAVSCKKNNPQKRKIQPPQDFNVTSQLNGSTAGSTSTATGTLSASYSRTNKTLTYNVQFTGTKPVNISLGSQTELASFVASIPKQGTKYASPLTGRLVLNANGEKALLEEKMFINVTSDNFPTGEIRGKLLVTQK